jgi:molybdenum-dependent DNA-binding transcriptional regulator ModE
MPDRTTRISPRLDFGDTGRLGSGKIGLLELIGERGSIWPAVAGV